MLDVIRSNYLEAMHALSLLPDWIAATALIGGSLLIALCIYAIIVQTLRSTFGVRHPKNSRAADSQQGSVAAGLDRVRSVACDTCRADR